MAAVVIARYQRDAGRNPRSISRLEPVAPRAADVHRDPRNVTGMDAARGRGPDTDRDRRNAPEADADRARGPDTDRYVASRAAPTWPTQATTDPGRDAGGPTRDFEGDEEFDFDVTGVDPRAESGQVDTIAESLSHRAGAEPEQASEPRYSPARITVLSGASAGRSILVESDEVIIGRVGVQVAAVDREDGSFRLRLREGDVTPILNGDRVPTNGAKLKNGDIFEVAGARLEFVAPR